MQELGLKVQGGGGLIHEGSMHVIAGFYGNNVYSEYNCVHLYCMLHWCKNFANEINTNYGSTYI